MKDIRFICRKTKLLFSFCPVIVLSFLFELANNKKNDLNLNSRVTAPKPDSVVYSRDYEFKEGFYLNYDQFKKNAPLPISAVISDYSKTETDFISQMMKEKFITYKTSDTSEQKIRPFQLWGYFWNRSLYINFQNNFYRVQQIGTVCCFLAITMYASNYGDSPEQYHTVSNDPRQFIFDTRINKIVV
jgi:hypothetical protein